jgi:biofilm PGA synthesis N-glycosyltransferase PgaC
LNLLLSEEGSDLAKVIMHGALAFSMSGDLGASKFPTAEPGCEATPLKQERLTFLRKQNSSLLLERAPPHISVGIAAYNEESNIGHLLEALREQLDIDDEIIVVASGCTDRTLQVTADIARADNRLHLIIEGKRNGKATALNKILTSYHGQLLLLISADVVPEKDTIKTMVQALEADPKVAMVSSHPVPINRPKGLAGHLGRLYWSLHNRTLDTLDRARRNTQGGEAILLRRGIVKALPLDCINDDAYIGVRAAQKGFRVKYCPQALVRMKAPETIPELIGQRRRILAGHLKVKEQTGQYPRVLTGLILRDPLVAIRIFASEFNTLPGMLRLFAAFYIEAIAAGLAILDHTIGYDHVRWKQAETTKTLRR